MIPALRTVLKKHFSPNNLVSWSLLALALKFAAFYILTPTAGNGWVGSFMVGNADTASYFDPIQNYIQNGNYWDAPTKGYRMPGYGIVYLILQFLLSSDAAIYNTIGILQCACSALAAVLLARMAFDFFKRPSAFYFVVILTTISPFNLLFNAYLLTESFSASFLVFGVYFLERSMERRSMLIGWVSSLFFLWAIFLRPNIFVIIPILLVYFVFCVATRKVEVRKALGYFLPMVMCFGLWANHNHKQHGAYSILTYSLYYPTIEETYVKEQMELFSAYGYPQVSIAFEEAGEVYYYLNFPLRDVVIHINDIDNYPVPSFNTDSVAALISLTEPLYNDTTLEQSVVDSVNLHLKKKLAAYHDELVAAYPWRTRVVNLFPILRDYVSIGGTGYTKKTGVRSVVQRVTEATSTLNALLTGLVIFGGVLGSLLLMLGFKRQDHYLPALIGCMALALFLSIPVVLRLGETRYMVPSYSFLILSLYYVLMVTYDRTVSLIRRKA